MKVSEEFPSEYLEAANLAGREVTVKIARIEKHKDAVGRDGRKFSPDVVFFDGKKKGMCLNKTNARRIRDGYGYGDDMEDWVGQEITIFPTTCNAFGNPNTPCIRVKVPTMGGVK